MTLDAFWVLLRRRWTAIAAGGLLGLLAALAYAQLSPVSYAASSTLYVSMATGTSVNDSYQGGLAAQQRVRSYLELADSAAVAERVLAERKLPMSAEELRTHITATSPPATSLLIITVTDGTAAGARDLTDAVVAQFRRLVDELETIETTAAPAARVAVVDRAKLPAGPEGPGAGRLVPLGLVAGLALGVGAAMLWDRIDRRLRSAADLEHATGLPVLAKLSRDPGPLDPPVRALRTVLRTGLDGDGVVVLSSVSPRSAPEVGLALARSFAATRARVLLVDADTTGTAALGPARAPGLAELLRRNGGPVAELLHPDSEFGVTLLPLGDVAADTADALASGALGPVLADLRGRFDIVIIEAPPVRGNPEAAVLAVGAAAVAVAELGTLTAADFAAAESAFTRAGAIVTGVVVAGRRGRRRAGSGGATPLPAAPVDEVTAVFEPAERETPKRVTTR
ncbi:Wzz/FepE/Etk N-terminal domain-containing protein [Nocardia thailandica]|uniref:Wzz/FepE/Etk N-terminal domain-containing protein n=1 Tax=Nocardia thailandica TaxID=257275 RepID=UPI000304146F|nr:Wzz/FepE/Etk N-terminal domain-containing protein [Nocardia thailandica]